MRISRFWKLLLVEIIAVISVASYFLLDSHDIYQWWVGQTTFTTASKECNLNVSECSARLTNDLQVRFDISPKPIPLMEALKFRASVEKIDLPFIELKLFSTNMNMGFHSFKLYAKGEGVYEGEGMLPTCIIGNMIWQANLIINTSSQSIGTTFYFQTSK